MRRHPRRRRPPAGKRKPETGHRLVVRFHDDQWERVERLVAAYRRSGHPEANKAMLVRLAVDSMAHRVLTLSHPR